ncbi:MAG: hypothetical protein IPN82_03570 [Chitinophagaceae bacterium]|nr:hypothetical protein [Chitinophagaceae bacterium]
MLVNKCNIYLPNDGIGLLTVAQMLLIGGFLKLVSGKVFVKSDEYLLWEIPEC